MRRTCVVCSLSVSQDLVFANLGLGSGSDLRFIIDFGAVYILNGASASNRDWSLSWGLDKAVRPFSKARLWL